MQYWQGLDHLAYIFYSVKPTPTVNELATIMNHIIRIFAPFIINNNLDLAITFSKAWQYINNSNFSDALNFLSPSICREIDNLFGYDTWSTQ